MLISLELSIATIESALVALISIVAIEKIKLKLVRHKLWYLVW